MNGTAYFATVVSYWWKMFMQLTTGLRPYLRPGKIILDILNWIVSILINKSFWHFINESGILQMNLAFYKRFWHFMNEFGIL